MSLSVCVCVCVCVCLCVCVYVHVCAKMMQTVARLAKFGDVLRTAQMNNNAVSRSVCVCVCMCVHVCVCVCEDYADCSLSCQVWGCAENCTD